MTIQAGDILVFKVDKLSFSTAIASGIRLVTGNKAVHVGIVLMIDGNEAIHWTDTNPFQAMKFHKTALAELKSGYGSLRLAGVASFPEEWRTKGKFEKEFLNAARKIYVDPASQRYSYRTITSQMIDHGYRRFKSADTPYKVWIKPKGFICSVLAAHILDLAVSKYCPNWTENARLETYEPDDFTCAPFSFSEI